MSRSFRGSTTWPACGRQSPVPKRSSLGLGRLVGWLALPAACAGCSSGVLATRLDRLVVCHDVTADALSSPVQIGSTFTTHDARAVVWLKLDDLAHPHTVRFRWYDPEGNLYLDSGPVALDPDGAFRPHATVSAGMPIAGAPAAWLPGEWKVSVDYDGENLTTQKFDVEER